jgi:hypothetical protein
MRGISVWGASLLLVLSTVASGRQMQMSPPLHQKAQTAHYGLVLKIGQMEMIYSKADVAKMHPTSGEVMTGGTMAMAGSGNVFPGGKSSGSGMGMEDTRHLEVHVTDRATGKVVTTGKTQITVTNDATTMSKKIPVATMYGVKDGPSDWHYGNNVSMPPGSYTVRVTVNGEQAAFHVMIPKM